MSPRSLILNGVAAAALLLPLAAASNAWATVNVDSQKGTIKTSPVANSANVTATTVKGAPAQTAPLPSGANVNVVQSRYVGPPIVDGETYTDYRSELSASGGANPVTAADAKGSGKAEVDTAHFASKLVGATIEDSSGKSAGTVDDIVLDYNGTADKVLIKDNGYFGKKGQIVALDYKLVDPGPGGKQLFKGFDKSAAKTAQPYPDKNSVRGVMNVTNLRGVDMKSPSQETVGKVVDIGIDAGKADTLIVDMNDHLLGLGKTHAVMNFVDANFVNKGPNGTYIQLNDHQAGTLKAAKGNK